MPSAWASGSTISCGAAETINVSRPARRWHSFDEARQHFCVEALEVDLAHPGHGPKDPLANFVAGVVARSEELERHGATRVADELVCGYQTGLAGLDGERERRRTGDERPIKVEECCTRAAAGYGYVLTH
jgi:hypothetical protein